MGFDWTSIENSFPAFREDESPKETAKKIHDYLYRLIKQLKFTLQNLDTGNWNQVALKNFAADTTKEVAKTTQEQAEALKLLADAQEATKANVAGQGEDITSTQNAVSNLQGKTEETATSLEGLAWDVGQNALDIEWLKQQLAELEGLNAKVEILLDSMERLEASVQAGAESTKIGRENTPLYLVGDIYINGVLYRRGESA